MLAERQFNLYKEISERKEVCIVIVRGKDKITKNVKSKNKIH